MPILKEKGVRFELHCLNGHRSADGGTVMLAMEETLCVKDVALRCYFCSICGYAELYIPKPQIEVERETDGRWIAELPAMPGAMAYGADKGEAVRKAKAVAIGVLSEEVE
jgi:hypothetical protein